MNECKVNCVVTDSIDNYVYNIHIYDSKQQLIYCDSHSNGHVHFNATNGLYQIQIQPVGRIYPRIVCKYIYVLTGSCNSFYFFFRKNLFRKRKITFWVTDKNYQDLPIEKGEMILWHRNI